MNESYSRKEILSSIDKKKNLRSKLFLLVVALFILFSLIPISSYFVNVWMPYQKIALKVENTEFTRKDLVEFIRFNQDNKKKGCMELLNEMKLKSSNVAYIGDDESDIPCCSIIPFSFAVKDSHKDLKAISRFCLNKNGGDGVITEFIEKLNVLNVFSKF